MEDKDFAKYQSLIGQVVVYEHPTIFGSITRRGKLIDIKYGRKGVILHAIIQRQTDFLFKTVQEAIPFEQIVVKKVTERYTPVQNDFTQNVFPNHHNGQRPPARSTPVHKFNNLPQSQLTNNGQSTRHEQYNSDYFQYNEVRYYDLDVSTITPLRVGDEVVWLPKNVPKSPLGRILRVGAQCLKNHDGEIFALVQFNEETNHLPRHLPYPPLNRNIVNLNELLLLSDWLATHENSSPNAGKDVNTQQPGNFPDLPPEDFVSHESLSNATTKSEEQTLPEEKLENLIDFETEAFEQPSSSRHLGNPRLKWTAKVSPDDFCSTVLNSQKLTYEPFGIQGNNNSCYMDSAIFSLFMFNNTLDYLLKMNRRLTGTIDHRTQLAEKVKDILRNDIISPLRQQYGVSWEAMKILRKVFYTEIGSQYKNSYMDTEEFILTFFNLIKAPELFTYDHGGSDYIHQIVLPTTWSESDRVPYISLQKLLEDSFVASEVKFRKPPHSAFIIKLPVSDGKLISSDGVIPNLAINVSKLLEKREQDKEAISPVMLHLHAVICLRSNHFVTFVRMDRPDNKQQRWVFMDSKPTTQMPEVHILADVSHKIEQLENEENGKRISKNEPKLCGIKLFRDAYICIYVPRI